MLKSKFNNLRGPALTDSALENAAPRPQAAKVHEANKPGVFKARLTMVVPILISITLNIIGQLVLKRGMSDLGPISLTEQPIFNIIFSIATNPFVIGGVIIYAGSTLCWLVGLSRAPLSYAYPFISLSYVVILVGSYFILGETINPLRLVGVTLICLGVLLVAAS